MAANASPPGAGPDELPAEVIDDLLASPRRRRILARLAERDTVSVADLATGVAASEADADGTDVDPDLYRTVRDDIFERHLPKLQATAVVQYDSMRGTVELAAPWIESCLEETSA